MLKKTEEENQKQVRKLIFFFLFMIHCCHLDAARAKERQNCSVIAKVNLISILSKNESHNKIHAREIFFI